MSSRRKAMLLLATNNKWLPYSYEYLLNSLVPTTIDNRNVLNQTKIIKLYGNGCVVNQLVALSNIRGTSTNYGITFFNNSDGSLTISGTATQRFDMSIVSNVALQSSHKYLIKTITGSANYLKTWLSGSASGETYDQTMIISPTSSGNMSIYFTFFANKTYNFTVFPQIIYLSHSFGLGNEPTSINDNRIQAILNRGYIPYNTGEYVGTDISDIVSYDTNNNLLATIPFKAQLNGAINSHDTLEITNSAYVFEKNIFNRDMGTMGWTYQSSNGRMTSLTLNGIIKPQTGYSTTGNIMCSKYTSSSASNLESSSPTNKSIAVGGNTYQICVYDSDYTDANAFTTAMSGTLLYFEALNPQTISIPRKHLGILPLSQVAESSFYPATSTNQRSEVIASGLPNCVAIADNQTPNAYMKDYNVGTPNATYTFTNGIFTVKQYDSNRIDFYICDNNIVGMTKAQMKEYLSNYLVFYETQDEVDDIVDKIGIEAGGSLSATYNTLALLNLDTKMKCK